MKVALVHDYLNEFGGAERVLLALSELYPDAPIYTAFYRDGSSAYKRFKGKNIITSWAQKVPFFASKLHSPLRFLAPLIWNSFDFSEFDVVIGSSSWYVTKGFKKGSKTLEICYCHTPPRYLYGYPTASNLQKHFLVRVYALLVNHFMRVYDFEAAQRVDWFIANSREVQGRIKKFYRRESTVIYPPVDMESFAGLTTKDKGQKQEKALDVSRSSLGYEFFLVVSRLVGVKNVDIAVEVCTNLKLELKVVGTGKDRERLEKMAGKTVEFLGDVDDRELVGLYQNCRALIFSGSQEDFGIVPVEAMAAGKPVIALAEGGIKETVIDGKTGLLVEDLAPGAFVIAINKFLEMEKKGEWDGNFIRKYAQKFGKERFKKEIKKFVEEKVKRNQDKVIGQKA
jgi:glycosyltransferase involved in cell wall biosynthesis